MARPPGPVFTVSKLRGSIYKTSKGLGDLQAVFGKTGSVGRTQKIVKRLGRRTVGKYATRGISKVIPPRPKVPGW